MKKGYFKSFQKYLYQNFINLLFLLRFDEVEGMTEVNGKEFPVTVKGPYTFSIGDTSSFGDYIKGGVALQVSLF